MATKEQRQKALTEIYKRDGEVRASAVVEFARPNGSPIHDELTWDNKKAAEQFRLSEARHLIRITPIRLETGEEQQLVHVRPRFIEEPTAAINEKEGSYKPIKVVAKNPLDYEHAMAELTTHLRAIEKTVRDLQKAAGEPVLPLVLSFKETMALARETLSLIKEQSRSA